MKEKKQLETATSLETRIKRMEKLHAETTEQQSKSARAKSKKEKINIYMNNWRDASTRRQSGSCELQQGCRVTKKGERRNKAGDAVAERAFIKTVDTSDNGAVSVAGEEVVMRSTALFNQTPGPRGGFLSTTLAGTTAHRILHYRTDDTTHQTKLATWPL